MLNTGTLGLLFILLMALGIGGFLYFQNQQQQRAALIGTFEDCASAGYPVMKSFPARCNTPDGRTFTQNIGNEMKYRDEIQVSKPRPNQEISSPLVITGQARGFWFFEGSFSAELFDADETSLGVAVIHAQGEWMTEEFVSFEGELEFITPEFPHGILVLSNANPSGLPENQKDLIIPVKFGKSN